MAGTMAPIAEQLLAQIRDHQPIRFAETWPHRQIWPHYQGLSLLNVAQTVLQTLGAAAAQPLDAAIWGGLPPGGAVDRVVVILTDGLGYHLLSRAMADDEATSDAVMRITDGRGPLPLTSVLPSTTAVALPTLWTGQAPGVHGMVGTLLFLRETGMLSNVLFFKPAVGTHRNGDLERMGVMPEALVHAPSLAGQLAEQGVPTHVLLDYRLLGSGLSKILHRDIGDSLMHTGNQDFWPRLEEILSQTRGQRCYVNAYWPVVDSLSHFYGDDAPYLRDEIRSQMQRMADILSNPEWQDGRTLVMIVADHGHANAPDVLRLDHDPAAAPIYEAMRLTFGAEARLAYAYLRDGQRDRIIQAAAQSLPQDLAVVDIDAALEAGLFGASGLYTRLRDRLGDVLLIPRPGLRLADDDRPDKSVSIHGGLSEAEMLVPLLWKRI